MVNDAGSPSAHEPPADPVTVMFLDLVRFTSLTEIHGDEAAADAALTLYELAGDVTVDGVRLVKTLGDGVLLVARTPSAAIGAAASLIERLHELSMGLDARGGADQGVVVERGGDVFGSSVNLASRAADVAQPGTLAVTRPVALAAGTGDFAVVPLGSRLLKGLMDPVELFQIDPCGHDEQTFTDPVCGMRIRRQSAVVIPALVDDGIVFCSARCADIYRDSPERFSA